MWDSFSFYSTMTPITKMTTRYNVLLKGKVVFWNVSENELFDRLEDYALESYVTGTPQPSDITYEVCKEDSID